MDKNNPATSSDDIAIAVRGLSKSYRLFNHPGDRIKQFFSFGMKQYHREFTAIEDVSFEIKKGETIGIIGRNGSGKSTLLQLLCRILKPSAGTVQVNGRVCALLELGAGFNPEFTGRENVYFQGALMGFTKTQMDARFDDIASFADIGEFIDQPVRSYSSGMFVKLAFSTIAYANADVLIIDEALSVGDAVFSQKCMRYFEEFRKRGTLILVSHDLGTITALCDRALWLEKSIRAQGKAGQICENYLSASFGSLPSRQMEQETESQDFADQRDELINCSSLRNDIELLVSAPAATSGSGLVSLVGIWLENSAGTRYKHVVGGELVTLVIRAKAHTLISRPIVGFEVSNHLGQTLIGDNTYLSFIDKPVSIPAGTVLEARFCFRMPRLMTGEYSVCSTIAEGVPPMHQIHHRVNNALTFRARSSSVAQVLVGLPMSRIELGVISTHD